MTRILAAIAIVALLPSIGIAFDSVSPRRGHVSVAQTDIALPTPIGPLPVVRNYGIETRGALGPGWSLDIEQRLARVGDDALLIGAVGREQTFLRRGGAFVGPEGARAQARGDGWRVGWPRGSTSTFDASGHEVERRDASGNTIAFAFDASRRLARIDGGAGHALTFRYGERDALAAVESTLGEKTRYAYDTSGRLVQATDADGLTTSFGYDAAGRLVAIDYPDGSDVRYAYDERNRVTEQRSNAAPTLRYSYSDRATRIVRDDGYWSEIRYDSVGLPIGYADSLGQTRTRSFDAEGRVVSEASPDATVAYEYDDSGRLVAVRGHAGALLRIAYDGDSARVARLDVNGTTKRYEYNAAGRLAREVSPAGRSLRYRYDVKGRLASIADDLGRTSQFVFDATGNLVSSRAPDGGEMRRRYDARGRVVEQRDVDGITTVYAYGANGQLASERTTGMPARDYRYDGYGRLIELRDGVDDMRLTYDGKGRIVRIDYADGTSESAAYEAAPNAVDVSDRLGRTTRYVFDPIGRLARVAPAAGDPMIVARDPARRAVTTTAGGVAIDVASDAARRTITVRGIDDALTRIGLDAFGRVTDIAAPAGADERRSYDPDGLLEAVTLPGGEAWRYRYDAAGQLTQVLHPGGAVTTWRYDEAGNPVAFSPPHGGTVTLRYAKGGRLSERTSASGAHVSYEYDPAGRLAARKTAAGTWRFRYDANGRLAEAGDGAYSIRYVYDAHERVIRVEHPSWGQTIGYAYDERGRMRERQAPDGTLTRYAYDAQSRLTRIDAPEGAFGFDYDARGRVAGRSYPNGTTTAYAYDAAGRIQRITHSGAGGRTIAAVTYAYDIAGNRVAITNERGERTVLRYDTRNRLVAEDGAGAHKTYEYGPEGDRSAVQDGGAGTRYRYDAKGHLVQAGSTTFEYDADGNRVVRRDAAGVTRYAYDAEGRLARVTTPDGRRVAYGYGPFGERVWRDEGGKRTYFVYDGDDVLLELSDRFVPTARYLLAGPDAPLSRVAAGERRFFHEDALGSLLAVSDDRGEALVRFSEDAFGNPAASSRADIAPQFAGRPRDPLTGLYDMRARAYDPATGSFVSPDPLPGVPSDPTSLAPYAYARANPLRYVDPYGLAPEPDRLILRAGDLSARARSNRVIVRTPPPTVELPPVRPVSPGVRSLAGPTSGLRTVIIRPSSPPAPGSAAAVVNEIAQTQQASMDAMFVAREDAQIARGAVRRLARSYAPVTQIIRPAAVPAGDVAAATRMAATVEAAGGVAALGTIAIHVLGDIPGEVLSGDTLSDAVNRRVSGIDESTVALGVGGGATLVLAAGASPVIATGLAAAAMGGLVWTAGSRVVDAVDEGVGAVVATWRQWDNEATAEHQAFRRDFAQMRASNVRPLEPLAPGSPVSVPPPVSATTPAAPSGTCPPGTVPARDGSCPPETTSSAALDTYSRAAQQQLPQQPTVTVTPGDRRPGRVGPGDIPTPPIGGTDTSRGAGTRTPGPARGGCTTNAECGPHAYCDTATGQCRGCPDGQRPNPDGSAGCIAGTPPTPEKPKDPQQPVKPGTPVEPPKPPTPPKPPEPADTKGWYGVEAFFSYYRGGSPCTIGTHKEIYGTRAEANAALRAEVANMSALLRGTERTDVRIERQGIYAGPESTKPTYTGDTRAHCDLN